MKLGRESAQCDQETGGETMEQDGWTWEPYTWEELEEARQVHAEFMHWLALHEEKEYRHWVSQSGA